MQNNYLTPCVPRRLKMSNLFCIILIPKNYLKNRKKYSINKEQKHFFFIIIEFVNFSEYIEIFSEYSNIFENSVFEKKIQGNNRKTVSSIARKLLELDMESHYKNIKNS